MSTYKYFLSATLLIKDEHEYVEEWIKWHLEQGIEHFYIYDNSTSIPISTALEKYREYCTYESTSFYEYNLQMESYTDALRFHGAETKWMAFIDTDEFIRPTGTQSLIGVLEEFPDVANIYMPWKIYNANGKIFKEEGLVRDRFTQQVKWPFDNPSWKSIVQPSQVKVVTAHSSAEYKKEGCIKIDTNGKPRIFGGKDLPDDKLVVDHYFTKSYQEWMDRLPKGSCDPVASRKMNWFEELNPGLLEAYGIKLGEYPQK